MEKFVQETAKNLQKTHRNCKNGVDQVDPGGVGENLETKKRKTYVFSLFTNVESCSCRKAKLQKRLTCNARARNYFFSFPEVANFAQINLVSTWSTS
jgi:hypothetical protein